RSGRALLAFRSVRQPPSIVPSIAKGNLKRPRGPSRLRCQAPPRLRRVSQPFFAAAERFSLDWLAPPLRPPLRELSCVSFFPRPEPDLLPPPDSLFTVAQARLLASFSETPRSSYPSAICSALRFCLSV